MLVALVFLIYAIVGIELFAGIKFQETINEDVNYNSFFIAVATLLRVLTGEGWNYVMDDMARKQSPIFICQNHDIDWKEY